MTRFRWIALARTLGLGVRSCVRCGTWGTLVVGLLNGCGLSKPDLTNSGIVPSDELNAMVRVTEAFWNAAADQDSVAMAVQTQGAKAFSWVTRWRSSYPTFFEVTSGHLTAAGAYFFEGDRDIAIMDLQVPWVTCEAPMYEGTPDHYHVKLVRRDRGWKIVDVWRDIC
jgi:hypothetical protein